MKGFTLIELMLVILIVGIVLSLAVVSLPSSNPEHRLQEQAERLHSLVRLALDEAILSGRPIGLQAETHGYGFLTFTDGAWKPVLEGPLRFRDLDADISLHLRTDGAARAPTTERETEDRRKPPAVVLWPSGEHTPFRLTLEHDASTASVSIGADELGRLALEPAP